MKLPALVIGAFAGVRGRSMARRRKRRPSRATVLWRIGLFLVAAVGVGLGTRWLLTAPAFAVVRVESGPYRFTSEAELQSALASCLGHNIWTLSTADVRHQLISLPWVRDLRVRRRLPDTVEVDFREWRPVAEIVSSDVADCPLVLLENGRVLPLPDHLEAPGLPVVVGCEPVTATDSLWSLGADTGAVLALVEALATTGLEAATPVDFLVRDDDGYAVVLQDGRARLKLGREEFAPRLERYLVARSQVPAGAEVDLRFRDRIAYVPVAEEVPQ